MTQGAFTTTLNRHFSSAPSVGKIGAVLFLIAIGVLIYVSGMIPEAGMGILAGLVLIPFVFLALLYPRIWLYGVALLGIAYFRGSSEGVSAIDVISAIVLFGSLSSWIVWQLAVAKRRLVYNTADWALLILFLILPLNLIIAVFNGVELLDWLREYIRLSMILFYFPIREYFREKKHLLRFLIIYGIVVFSLDFFQFYAYYKATFTNLIYAYQLGSSVRINQVIFTTASIFGMVFGLYSQKRWIRFTMIFFVGLTVSALVVSFSRAFWIVLMAEYILLFFYIPMAKKKRLMLTSLVIALFMASSVYMLIGDKVVILYKLAEKRLSSSTKGTKDISLLARLKEWEKAVSHIEEYPLGGNGLSREFSFYDPISSATLHTNYIHNDYIFITYRIGIPLAACFFMILIYFLILGEQLSRKSPDEFYKKVAIGGTAGLLVMLSTAFITSNISGRDGSFLIAVSLACIAIARDHLRANKLFAKKNKIIYNG